MPMFRLVKQSTRKSASADDDILHNFSVSEFVITAGANCLQSKAILALRVNIYKATGKMLHSKL